MLPLTKGHLSSVDTILLVEGELLSLGMTIQKIINFGLFTGGLLRIIYISGICIYNDLGTSTCYITMATPVSSDRSMSP